MEVKLLHSTPLWVADLAISKCYDKKCNRDEINTKRIENVVNENKLNNAIKHIIFNFEINGISRALLQELAKHKMASLSVKSTKYMLKELGKELPFELKAISRVKKYVVLTENDKTNVGIIKALENLRILIRNGLTHNPITINFPKEYRTSLIWTIDARSLKIFLKLGTSSNEIWEMKNLAYEIYDKIPTSYKFLFEKEIHSKE